MQFSTIYFTSCQSRVNFKSFLSLERDLLNFVNKYNCVWSKKFLRFFDFVLGFDLTFCRFSIKCAINHRTFTQIPLHYLRNRSTWRLKIFIESSLSALNNRDTLRKDLAHKLILIFNICFRKISSHDSHLHLFINNITEKGRKEIEKSKQKG